MAGDPQPAVPAKNVTGLPQAHVQATHAPAQAAARQYSAFVPNLLLALALVGWLAFQAFQQAGEHQQLAALDTSSAAQEQAAQKVRTSLEAVATATAKLAVDGNANAQVVVDQLRKRGVTINPGAASSPQ
jgi:hypothetical protein